MAPFFKPFKFSAHDGPSRQVCSTCLHVLPVPLLRQPARQTALIIALSYHGSTVGPELQNAHSDAQHLSQCLVKQGFQPENVRLLLDDGSEPMPLTAENILDALRSFVKGAQCGDDLVFAFIGHGGQEKDQNGDEEDGLDEVLVAVDGEFIIDDKLNATLVKPLPSGVQLTILMDCCNAGTSVDLPFLTECGADGRMTPPSIQAPTYRQCEQGKGLSCLHQDSAKVICLSACRDGETAWDFHGNSYTLVDFFVKILHGTNNKRMSCEALLQRLDHYFEKRTAALSTKNTRQHPQLSSNYHLSPKETFKLIRNAERHAAPQSWMVYVEKLLKRMHRISLRH